MTAGWESLGDWLHDQARELGHIVKPRPRPVAVPSLEEMPLTENVPVCEWTWYASGEQCSKAATVRLRSHLILPTDPCPGVVTALTCEQHWDTWRRAWELLLAFCPFTCEQCGREMRHLHDAIPTVIPL